MIWLVFKIGRKVLKMFGKKKPPVANTSSKGLAGPGYLVLNTIRLMNIVALLMVAVASWVMIVMNVKTNNFFFFDAVAHFITSIVSIFLIVSECNIFKFYFARNWPKFGIESGFVFLGLSMIVLGFNILANLNKEATSRENLGMTMWRIVISSGIVASVMGLINLIVTFIFCDSKQGISSRQVRSHGASLGSIANDKTAYTSRSNSTRSQSSTKTPIPMYHEPTYETEYHEQPALDTANKRRSRFPIRLSMISRPKPNNHEQFNKWEDRSYTLTRDDVEAQPTIEIDDRASPIMPEIQRPPTATHPMFRGTTLVPPPLPPASSRYSVASNITRFTRHG